ncbi:MAG: prepilin-type N-terminal cleavage/methylation domain-containing protein, partial [Candidatus Sericytochromatia bacterium]|nr:prepilin-type N-terminal cleavage/methylation domain-containing protein [Candidatus Sericytochromatia bacterium]
MKNKGKNRGFTIIELVIGLGIGIVVLTGLMTFYFRSSKMIGEQQAVAKDATQLQFVM